MSASDPAKFTLSVAEDSPASAIAHPSQAMPKKVVPNAPAKANADEEEVKIASLTKLVIRRPCLCLCSILATVIALTIIVIAIEVRPAKGFLDVLCVRMCSARRPPPTAASARARKARARLGRHRERPRARDDLTWDRSALALARAPATGSVHLQRRALVQPEGRAGHPARHRL
jgi:hypothetical protein